MVFGNRFQALRDENKGDPAGSGDASGGSNDDSGANLEQELAAARASLAKEEKRRRKLEADYGELKQTVSDLKRVADEAKEKEAQNSPETLEAWKKEKEAEIRGAFSSDLEKATSERDKLKNQVTELTTVAAVFSAGSDLFNEDCHDDYREQIRKRTKVAEDGTRTYLDDDGNEMYSPTSRSKKMNDREFAIWVTERKPSWAKAEQKPGARQSGTQQESTPKGNVKGPPAGFDGWSQKDQSKWMQENREAAKAYIKSLQH